MSLKVEYWYMLVVNLTLTWRLVCAKYKLNRGRHAVAQGVKGVGSSSLREMNVMEVEC